MGKGEIKYDELDLEKRYQEYLKLCELKEETMHPAQRIETRRAFYGGLGSMFRLFSHGFDDLEGKAMDDAFDSIDKQILDFFTISSSKEKKNLN